MSAGLDRYAAPAVLAVVVAFNLILLAPELRHVPPLNDGILHYGLIARASEAISRGEFLLDHWNATWVLGFPVFHYYQHVPHIAVALIGRVIPVDLFDLFNVTRVLLLAFFPVALYAGVRCLSFSRVAALTASAAATLLASPGLFGFELESYLWSGSGLYTQIWGMILLPLVIGATFRFLQGGRHLALPATLFALITVSHTIYAYMAAISIVVIACLPTDTPLLRRLLRAAAILSIGAVIVAYFLVPLVSNAEWLNRSTLEPAWKYDGMGHQWALKRLFDGRLLDNGRFPALTLLTMAGLAHAAFRRTVADRIALALFGVWLALFLGRPTWGVLLDVLPFSSHLHLHRFIGGIHFAALMLIGIGAEAIWSLARRRKLQAIAAAAIVLMLLPAYVSRFRLARYNAKLIETNATTLRDADGLPDLLSAIARAQRQHPGRLYAGFATNWGSSFRVGEIPLYTLLSFHRQEMVGYAYHAMSYMADIQYHFDDRNYRHYQLFNVAHVLAPRDWNPPPFLNVVAQGSWWTLYRGPSNGYFEVIVPNARPLPPRDEIYRDAVVWLRGPMFTPAGGVLSETTDGLTYTATVATDRPALLLFRMSFHPWWRAVVDGSPRHAVALMPPFTAVPIRPGDRQVTLAYRPALYKKWLFVFGAVAILLLWIGDHRRRVSSSLKAISRDAAAESRSPSAS